MLRVSRAKAVATSIALIGLAIAAPAVASVVGPAGQSFSVVGEVPVICRATVQSVATPSASVTTYSGVLSEFCNAPGGYAVYARLGGAVDEATLLVDGQAIARDVSGAFVVSRSSHANVAARKLQLSGVTSSTTIIFQIVPI